MPFHLIKHPLALHKLTHMRGSTEACPSRTFTLLMKEIGMVMASEVIGQLYKASATKPVFGVNSADGIHPVSFEGEILEEKKPIMIPILRSGLIMAQGMQEIISTSFTGHLGIYHDEASDNLVLYFSALPEYQPDRYFFLIDPVIATGGTASLAIQTLKDYEVQPEKIIFISLIVGAAGQKRLENDHPDVTVFAIKSNEEMSGKRILRGLGSVSDRQFRTI